MVTRHMAHRLTGVAVQRAGQKADTSGHMEQGD